MGVDELTCSISTKCKHFATIRLIWAFRPFEGLWRVGLPYKECASAFMPKYGHCSTRVISN
jgi:hypothetical protein